MMLDRFAWPRPDDASDEKLISDVKTYGWHAVGVAEGDDEPPFVYSVGLYLSYGHPEIIVLGLTQNVGHTMIANAVTRVKTGEHIEWDVRNPDILQGYDVVFKIVGTSKYRDYLGYALWFYRSLLPETFPTLQLVWPDKSGRFPWNAGFEPSLLCLQPLLTERLQRTPAAHLLDWNSRSARRPAPLNRRGVGPADPRI
jgi:hypothetical protein